MNFGARRTGRRGTSITLAPAGSANIAISLAKGVVITGVISDVDGLAAPGATVELMVDRFDPRQGERRLVRHDPAKTISATCRAVSTSSRSIERNSTTTSGSILSSSSG